MATYPFDHSSPMSHVSPDILRTDWHPRKLHDFQYVYAVLSRRSGGISIGVNLNPDKVCNYGCIYCEVNRKIPGGKRYVDIPKLESELFQLLDAFHSQDIFKHPPFDGLSLETRILRDIAFSGDGEPTSFRNFALCVDTSANLLRRAGFDSVKVVVITNATYLQKKWMIEALAALDRCNSEIWAKLDAGTQEYMSLVNQTKFPIRKLIDNIAFVGRERSIVIQSLFMNINGVPPNATELDAYIGRLVELIERGTQIAKVQVYTVARPPAESYVTPLEKMALDVIVQRIKEETKLDAQPYY